MELKSSGSDGVIYKSVRRPGGECVGIFRPRVISPVIRGPHFEYRWDGSAITEILQVQRYTDDRVL